MPGIFAEKTKCTVPDFARMLNSELVAELRQQVYNGMEKFSPLRALVEEVAERLMQKEVNTEAYNLKKFGRKFK